MTWAAVATLAHMTGKPVLASCPSGLHFVSWHFFLVLASAAHGAGRPEDALGSSSMQASTEG